MRDAREDWLETSRGTLVYVIVLDQFSRNIFRGSARMFESDPCALALDARRDRLWREDARRVRSLAGVAPPTGTRGRPWTDFCHLCHLLSPSRL
jgi:hypothetical protein